MNSKQIPGAVVCVANEGNEVSLQLWKIYKTLRDDDAESEGFMRVIDESGEDYLFPKEDFVRIDLPAEAKKPFERAIREQRRATTKTTVSPSVKRLARTNQGRKRIVQRGRLTSRSS
jgi:hypothetical protein